MFRFRENKQLINGFLMVEKIQNMYYTVGKKYSFYYLLEV